MKSCLAIPCTIIFKPLKEEMPTYATFRIAMDKGKLRFSDFVESLDMKIDKMVIIEETE